MRPRTVPFLLALGGLAWAGVHMLMHHLSEAGGAHAGHELGGTAGHPAYLSTSLSLCLSLAIVLAAGASIYPTWRGTSARSLWLFAAAPLLGLFGDSALDSQSTLASLGANVAGLVPVALLVLVVQVAVAATAVTMARGLLDLVEGAAHAVAGPLAQLTPVLVHSLSPVDVDRTPADRLLRVGGGPRAPPGSSPAA